PTAADRERALQLEQEEHELRFQREIMEGDMLALVERDPTLYFNIKSLFNKLQTPRTNEALFQLVTQAENFLEQYAKNFHHLNSNILLRNTQISAQLDHFNQATKYNEEVAKIKTASTSAFLQVAACEDN
ncbi:hypothetical protein A2U01_0058330, partial [Trifolium medium]|nr:hypothetical protein [Trifolium medium]